jgi:signal transduction histidine kinase/CheY-like chemotaxis protein
MTAETLVRVALAHDEDVVVARRAAREVAAVLGFDRQDQTRIATATSELARNAHRYARGGAVALSRHGDEMVIEVTDQGPGIPHLDEVLAGRYRSRTGMGQGLVGVRRLMDGFDIASSADGGTRVAVSKRLPVTGRGLLARELRDRLRRRGAGDPYQELTLQNQELLRALGELRARQQELLALNRELEDTNRGVVALYAELDDRADQLRDADERKSRFLADMSHELRTPLNSIIALTQLLMDGEAPLGAEQRTQVAFIKRMAEDQLRLVGDLLDLAKIEAGRVVVELSEVAVPELFALLRVQLRPLVVNPGVELRFDAEPDLPPLRTDDAKLVQVVRNLVSNALKFTADGTVEVIARRNGEGLELAVSDTGVGIAPDDLDRIFEEFVQIPGELQQPGAGTGLGLPLARKLVGLLGGTLEASSAPGQGTTFSVRLPFSPATAAPDQAPADPTGGLLLVDDDEASRYILRTHLRDSSWTIVEASSGTEALSTLQRGVPAAIVLDLSMPDIDGVEVLQRLRADERLRATPVVVHTSRLLDASARAALEAHGAVLLDKSRSSRVALIEALAEATGGQGAARG